MRFRNAPVTFGKYPQSWGIINTRYSPLLNHARLAKWWMFELSSQRNFVEQTLRRMITYRQFERETSEKKCRTI